MNKERGSILLPVMLLVLLLGSMSAAMVMLTTSHARSSTEDLDQELAIRVAESGLAFYFGQVLLDGNYFSTNPAPHAPIQVGDAEFTLEAAVTTTDGWDLTITGTRGRGEYEIRAIIGGGSLVFPPGIVVAGTGVDGDVALRVRDKSLIGSFDPASGAFDPANPGTEATIAINGSLTLSGGSQIKGDVTASGTLDSGSPSDVSGTLTENGGQTPVENIDPIVLDLYDSSRTANDNGDLGAIFGVNWFPLLGPENYGDLVVADGGTYVVPSGTYRVRRFEVRDGTTVIFDTSGGPVKFVYVGAGQGTGTLNDLTLDTAGKVLVDSGGTQNGLLTVLGQDTDFRVLRDSVYGQSVNDPNNSGYTQIISLGGNASADEIEIDHRSTVHGRLYAAAHNLLLKNGSEWHGSAVARTVDLNHDGIFAIDRGSLGTSVPDSTTHDILARWRSSGP